MTFVEVRNQQYWSPNTWIPSRRWQAQRRDSAVVFYAPSRSAAVQKATKAMPPGEIVTVEVMPKNWSHVGLGLWGPTIALPEARGTARFAGADWFRISVHESAHAVVATLIGVKVRDTMLGPEHLRGSTELVSPERLNDLDFATVVLAPSMLTRHAPLAHEIADDMKRLESLDPTMRRRARFLAAGLIAQNWPAIQAVARELQQRGALTGREVAEIVNEQNTSRGYRRVPTLAG